jgi:hypothetical protein
MYVKMELNANVQLFGSIQYPVGDFLYTVMNISVSRMAEEFDEQLRVE